MRTPSTSTMVFTAAAPRSKAPVLWPGPPFRDNCTPASRRSRSASESAVEASMSARSITTTSAAIRSCVMGIRLPVMTSRVSARPNEASPSAVDWACADAPKPAPRAAEAAHKTHEGMAVGVSPALQDSPNLRRRCCQAVDGQRCTSALCALIAQVKGERRFIARHSSRTPRAAQVDTWPKSRKWVVPALSTARPQSLRGLCISTQHVSRQTPPSATSATRASGRYPGLRVPDLPRGRPEASDAFPGLERAQWLQCRALLADRCGGSAGIVRAHTHGCPCQGASPTGFPLNPPPRAQRQAPGASRSIVAPEPCRLADGLEVQARR